jgi:hypothetical protein
MKGTASFACCRKQKKEALAGFSLLNNLSLSLSLSHPPVCVRAFLVVLDESPQGIILEQRQQQTTDASPSGVRCCSLLSSRFCNPILFLHRFSLLFITDNYLRLLYNPKLGHSLSLSLSLSLSHVNFPKLVM